MDSKNMYVETVVSGDEVNYPIISDVRVRYNCTLVATGKVSYNTD